MPSLRSAFYGLPLHVRAHAGVCVECWLTMQFDLSVFVLSARVGCVVKAFDGGISNK